MRNCKCFILLIIIGLCGFSCQRFEDGPDFSLRTRKARLCREWLPEKLYVDGVNFSIKNFEVIGEVIFEKNDSFFFVSNPRPKGIWDIKKNELILTTLRNDTVEKIRKTILRLTAKEFWTEEKDAQNKTIEWHYKAQKSEKIAKKDSTTNKENTQHPGTQIPSQTEY